MGWDLAFSQALADPSRPALDVAALYGSVPPDRLTDRGREAYAGYQAVAPTDYGTERDQLGRVLTALGQWLAVAMSYAPLTPTSPAVGPTRLAAADAHAGQAELPEGYTAYWDTTRGSLCVEGRLGGTGLEHVTQEAFADPGAPVTPFDGPCPTS